MLILLAGLAVHSAPSSEKAGQEGTKETIWINANRFPDANFRNYLLLLYPNGYITDDDFNACTYMNINGRSISDLTGIGYFIKLTYLSCNNCQLTSLPELPSTIHAVYAKNNKFTTLSITGKSDLITLDVQDNTLLTSLVCHNNALTTLNVSGCSALTNLSCQNNQLASISVAGMANLKQLYCNGNNLSSLSVEGCSSLQRLDCYNNQIKNAEMTALVNSLRTIPEGSQGTFQVTYDVTDGNFFSNVNMNNTRQKRWKPYKYENGSWVEIVDINYDVNRDGVVDPEDANKLLLNIYWYTIPDYFDPNADGDFNFDEVLGFDDLNVLLALLKTNPMNLDVTPYKGLGDVDGNGKINSIDFFRIEQFIESNSALHDFFACTDSKDVNGDGKCDYWDYFIVYFCVQNGWEYIRGDINGDRKVDVSDVNAVINIMLGKTQASDFPGEANVDGQGNVDVSDVNKIINIMLGKQ